MLQKRIELGMLLVSLLKFDRNFMKKTDPPIIVEQIFDRSIEEVWNAITQVDLMCQWFFNNIPSFKPEIGFETQFLVKTEEREFLHLWEIIEVIPLKKIIYDWRYANYEGVGLVAFELFDLGNQTLLKLTNIVVESFEADIPEFKRESGITGWNYFIKQRLPKFFASQNG